MIRQLTISTIATGCVLLGGCDLGDLVKGGEEAVSEAVAPGSSDAECKKICTRDVECSKLLSCTNVCGSTAASCMAECRETFNQGAAALDRAVLCLVGAELANGDHGGAAQKTCLDKCGATCRATGACGEHLGEATLEDWGKSSVVTAFQEQLRKDEKVALNEAQRCSVGCSSLSPAKRSCLSGCASEFQCRVVAGCAVKHRNKPEEMRECALDYANGRAMYQHTARCLLKAADASDAGSGDGSGSSAGDGSGSSTGSGSGSSAKACKNKCAASSGLTPGSEGEKFAKYFEKNRGQNKKIYDYSLAHKQGHTTWNKYAACAAACNPKNKKCALPCAKTFFLTGYWVYTRKGAGYEGLPPAVSAKALAALQAQATCATKACPN